MSAFTCLSQGSEAIRTIQQQLNYDYYDYYQICPCDELYNRDMNKMLIYALQKELGISKTSATGTWGPSTISACKTKTFNIGNSSQIVKLIRYATVCNGFPVNTSSSTYDANLDSVLDDFANSLLIQKPNNQVNYTVIKSLLSSNGDTDRAALGCDTATKLTPAKIQTIKNAGYQYVGRYITNTPGGTLDKCLTRTEIENIQNAGLKLFYIFQESNNSPEKFDRAKGELQALKAIYAMDSLGAPANSTIYFAVDCDPLDNEINNYIIPYFRGVINAFSEENVNFKVGVSGKDNVSYGALRNPTNNYQPSKDIGIYIPSPEQRAMQGRLYINMNDSLHVYGKIMTSYEMNNLLSVSEPYAFPRDEDLICTLPKYAMYLNIGVIQSENEFTSSRPEDFNRFTFVIKFLDNNGNIRYGYIPVNSSVPVYDNEGTSTINAPVSNQIASDIEAYGNQ